MHQPHTKPNLPEPGATVDDLDTPALCLDLDVMESNIRVMAAECREHGVAWRPHSKGHKSPEIARAQLEAGALGVTCAKLGEAEVMADGGIGDVLIANQVVGRHKMPRLVELARRAEPIVAVDDLAQVEPIAQAAAEAGVCVRLLIEIDVGMRRAGVLPGDAVLRLAQDIDRQPGVELAGIMGYEGHLLTVADLADKQRQIAACMEQLAQTKASLQRAGLPCPIVSAAGTGSYAYTMRCPGVTELQAGGLIFMDAYYRHACQVERFDYALKVLTTVVSRPAPDRAIIDAGRKTLDIQIARPLVAGRDDIRVAALSAEHGRLELDPSARDLRVGDRLELIPGYADMTTFLHDAFYGFRQGRLDRIIPLAARGRLQ